MRQIVLQVCDALWNCLVGELMPVPDAEHWKRIEEGFRVRWNFPNCIGSLDGKHIALQAPPNSGSVFYNYKGFFSVVLLALVDAGYRFVIIDVGSVGSNSDGGIFQNSELGQRLNNGNLDIPGPKQIDNVRGPLPHVIVADEAFPLKENLLRPYPGSRGYDLTREQRIFNYRLSRARRISENAFGMLCQRFRVFFRRIQVMPESAIKIVKACCILHNYLTVPFDDHTPGGGGDGGGDGQHNPAQPEAFANLPNMRGNHGSRHAMMIRECFESYFNNEGQVPWQNERI